MLTSQATVPGNVQLGENIRTYFWLCQVICNYLRCKKWAHENQEGALGVSASKYVYPNGLGYVAPVRRIPGHVISLGGFEYPPYR